MATNRAKLWGSKKDEAYDKEGAIAVACTSRAAEVAAAAASSVVPQSAVGADAAIAAVALLTPKDLGALSVWARIEGIGCNRVIPGMSVSARDICPGINGHWRRHNAPEQGSQGPGHG